MKRIKNGTLVNTSNQTSQEKNETGFQTNQLNVCVGNSNKVYNPLFRLMEGRYGIQIIDEILVGVDRICKNDPTSPNSNLVAVLTADQTMENIVEVVDVKEKDIKTVAEIYDITSTGFNSVNHSSNFGKTKQTGIYTLIPIIKLVREDIVYYTKLDNKYLRDIFYDSELILNGDEDNPTLTREDLEIELEDQYFEQMDILNEIFCIEN